MLALMTFRYGAAERAAAVIWLLAATALATTRWWLLPVLLVPLAALAAAFRLGTDITAEGITIRAVVVQRRMPWAEVAEFRPDGARRVVVVRTDGRAVRLPAVRPADLARLTRAS